MDYEKMCEKHDREADANSGGDTPGWRGIEEDKHETTY